MSKAEKSPFSAGEIVVYKPTPDIIGHNIMTDLVNLIPGRKYKISEIKNGIYIILEGFESSPTGGLYWNAFEKVKYENHGA